MMSPDVSRPDSAVRIHFIVAKVLLLSLSRLVLDIVNSSQVIVLKQLFVNDY